MNKKVLIDKIKEFVGEGGLVPFEHGFPKPLVRAKKIWGVNDTTALCVGSPYGFPLEMLNDFELERINNTLHKYLKYCQTEA